MTETWLLQSDIGIVSAALPDKYSIMSVCRPEGRGGGVALICTLSISNIKQIPRRMDVVSFEYMEISFCWRRRCFRLVVYSPGHPETDVDFLREFGSLLEVLLTLNGELLILGDFNYWIDNPHLKPYTTEFLELLDLNNIINQVSGPIHVRGHTLDLLLTPRDMDVINCAKIMPI